MLSRINDILSRDRIERLNNILAQGTDDGSDAAEIVEEALLAHPLFLLAVEPLAFSPITLRQFDEGMQASNCVEDAVSGGNIKIRADVRVVLFLSDMSNYDGGELVVDGGCGEETIKENAGDCVVFPASANYRVCRVIRGTRRTAELSVQSLFRAPEIREILYDIGYSLHLVEMFGGKEHHSEAARLRRCQQNLRRLWAEL